MTFTRDPIYELAPISIAVENLKIGKNHNNLNVAGIDLDSGRKVSLDITTEGDAEPMLPTLTDGMLVLVITLERLTHS